MKALLYRAKYILESDEPIHQKIKIFLAFQFSVWLLHLLIISGISFFHLILNHSLGTIAEWINEKGWHLIIITKLLILSIYLQFYSLKLKSLSRLKYFLRNGIQLPRTEFFVLGIFVFVGFISIAKPVVNDAFILEVDKMIISYLGYILFFLVDFVIFAILEMQFPSKIEEKHRLRFLFALLFYLGTHFTFQYELLSTSVINFFIFYLLLYFADWRRFNWSLPVLYLGLFLAPVNVFLGNDPVWQNQFSFFRLSKKISTPEYVLLVLFVFLYLGHYKRKNPEYIYRD